MKNIIKNEYYAKMKKICPKNIYLFNFVHQLVIY